MTEIAQGRDWRSLTEPLALSLILFTVAGSVLGSLQAGTLAMAPLIAGLLLLLIGGLPRQPLTGGWLLLVLLTLRETLRGSDRYAPQEISVTDYLLVLAAAAAGLQASAGLWRRFLAAFALVIPLLGGWEWLRQITAGSGAPLAAGSLSAPQSALIFGLSLCLALERITAAPAATDRSMPRWLARSGWTLLTLLSASLSVASGGPVMLLLVAMALAGVQLIRWGRNPTRRRNGRWRAGVVVVLGLLAGGTLASLLPGPVALAAGNRGPGERLALLSCFVHVPFSQLERLFLGVGLTNSSGWLCQAVRPGERLIQADNLIAQIAADQGLIALAGGAALVVWWAGSRARWPEPPGEARTPTGLTLALFTLLTMLNGNGWAQSSLLQVLIGLQLGWLGLPREARS
jgi:hypothetical protein